jgi:hypothetical protein
MTSALVKYLIGALLLLAAIVYVVHALEHRGFVKGAASRDAEVAQLIADRDKFKRERDALEQTNANAVVAHEEALELQKAGQRLVLADLESRLNKAEEALSRFRTVLNTKVEVAKYVTPKADRRTVITDGFVWVHNHPISTDPEATGLPASGPSAVDADSGLAASEVAQLVADNYAVCQQRGEMIGAFQDWYNGSYLVWKAAVERQGAYVTVSP